MNEEIKLNRLGNLGGFTGGSYAYQVYGTDGLCPTLTRMGDGGGRVPHIVECWSAAMRGRYLEDGSTKQNLEINNQETCNAITTIQKDYLCMEKGDRYRVRRLSPAETWALMGIKEEDFKRAEEATSATQLLRQAGNGICITVLMALFSQLGIEGIDKWNDMSEDEIYSLIS